jgi:hypothetical protein
VLHVADHDAVTLQCNDGDTFKVNGQCLKLFLEPEPHDFEEIDVLDFLELELLHLQVLCYLNSVVILRLGFPNFRKERIEMNCRILKEGVGQNPHFLGGKCGHPALSQSQTSSVFPVEFIPLHTQHLHSLKGKTPRE